LRDYLLDLSITDGSRSSRTRFVEQALQPMQAKAFAPLTPSGSGDVQLFSDGSIIQAFGARRTILVRRAVAVPQETLRFQRVYEHVGTTFGTTEGFGKGVEEARLLILNWLPPRDSNPDMLIQSQESELPNNC
jgi:hypothetical protein